MGIRRSLCLAVLVFGILAGCSRKVDTPRDVASLPSDDEGPSIDKQPAKRTANDDSRGTPKLSEAAPAELRKKPITSAKDEIGVLLTKWWNEGVAAGNIGDYYDNRDEAHSILDTKMYPQVQQVVYTADEIKKKENWSLSMTVRPHVTFGNASTAAPTKLGGSNPRSAYSSTFGLTQLAEQYKGNNLYIYPECGDHTPGHNGLDGGYGDIYPTNTPYLIISQGISWSDQPFMRAVALTLAAFRPEVKRKLTENGLLMPTVQMILRSTNKRLADPKDYLTGKAHPTVFEGSSVDALRMVKLAHEITVETVPPLVRLEVVEEDAPENGLDYFEPKGLTEALATTPQVIARIWRGKSGQRRMIVSAAGSLDLNKKPLTFHWMVLRGDEKRIRITPRNKTNSEVEIVVPYHPRRPIAPNVALESNRVDIGVFVHNGTYYSAPGFITFYTLDNESRAYDEKGRPVEIGYGGGDVSLRVSDYEVLLQTLGRTDAPAAKLFDLTDTQRAVLKGATESYNQLQDKLKKKRAEVTACEAREKADEAKMKEAQAEVNRTEKALRDNPSEEAKAALASAKKKAEEAAARFKQSESAIDAVYDKMGEVQEKLRALLAAKQSGLGGSVTEFVNGKLRQLLQNPSLFNTHEKLFRDVVEKAVAARRSAVEVARQRLIRNGVATNLKDGRLEWHLIRSSNARSVEHLTLFSRQLVEGFNGALLSELLLPGALSMSSSPNFVSQYLFAAKSWRDVYLYDAKGKSTGWTRYDARGITRFTEDGLMVLETDDKDRPTRVRTVRYDLKEVEDQAEPDLLVMSLDEDIIVYAYDKGKRVEKSRHKAKEKKE